MPPLIKSPDLPSPSSPPDNFPRSSLQTLSLAASFLENSSPLFDQASQTKKASSEERTSRGARYEEPFSAGSHGENGPLPPDVKKPRLDTSFVSQKKPPSNGVQPPMKPTPAESQVPFPANLSPKSCGDSDYGEERVSPSPPTSPYPRGSPSQRGCDSPVARRRNSSSSTDSGTEDAKDGELIYHRGFYVTVLNVLLYSPLFLFSLRKRKPQPKWLFHKKFYHRFARCKTPCWPKKT